MKSYLKYHLANDFKNLCLKAFINNKMLYEVFSLILKMYLTYVNIY